MNGPLSREGPASSAVGDWRRRGLRAFAAASLVLLLTVGTVARAADPLPKVRVAADGRTFVTAGGKRYVPFGVSYFRPHTGWAPQVWKQFDASAVRQDFQLMREAGVNCVRVFLSFGSFYQQPGVLSPIGLEKFDQFLALAEEAGMYVHPTGPDHWEGLPEWARGDRYADDTVLSALETFWKLFATRYRGRTALFAYDLLNEPEVRWDTPAMRDKWNRWLAAKYGSSERIGSAWGGPGPVPSLPGVPVPPPNEAPGSKPLLDYQRFRENVAEEWTRRQAAAIKAADPNALVTVGLIQWSVPSLVFGVQHYSAFRPDRQAPFLDFIEIHFYPLDQGFYEYGRPEAEERNLAYLESVVREAARPGKPVVVAEFGWYGGGRLTIDGGKHPAATEEDQARWCSRAIDTTAHLATGWLNWGFFDCPEAGDVSQLTGLFTVDGKAKAWGRTFQGLAARHQGQAMPPPKPLARPELDWDACITSPRASNEFRDRYFQAFRAERARPAQP